jgi:alpha-N-arabinofuranosidase
VVDTRVTPYHRAHSTEIAGLADSTSGDHRFYNNVFGATAPSDVGDFEVPGSVWDAALDDVALPCTAGGNVYASGVDASRFDPVETTLTDADIHPQLTQGAEGWFLSLGGGWPAARPVGRDVVTTQLLGRAAIPGVAFENFDGSPLTVDTDYLGAPRSTNPTPGPFESATSEPIRVWPKA